MNWFTCFCKIDSLRDHAMQWLVFALLGSAIDSLHLGLPHLGLPHLGLPYMGPKADSIGPIWAQKRSLIGPKNTAKQLGVFTIFPGLFMSRLFFMVFNYSEMANVSSWTYSKSSWIIFGTFKNSTEHRSNIDLSTSFLFRNIQKSTRMMDALLFVVLQFSAF